MTHCDLNVPMAAKVRVFAELLDCLEFIFFSFCFLSISIHIVFISDSYKTDFELDMWYEWSPLTDSIWTQQEV